MIRQAVILAAGRGTRLGSLTKDRPKSMLPVVGKPIIAHLMYSLQTGGVEQFVLVVGSDDRAVTGYFSHNGTANSDVIIVHQRRPTGTVDALLEAAPHITGPFLLSAVDNLTSPAHVSKLSSTFLAHPDHVAALSLLPATPEQIRQSSDVLIDGNRIAGIEEKPTHPRSPYAGIMLYAFSPRLLPYLSQVKVSPRGEREIASAIQASILDGGRVGYAITDWRLHLTRDTDLLAINRYFLQNNHEHAVLSRVPATTTVVPPVRIDPGVLIGADCVIGPNVYLEAGSVIAENATLVNCVVLRGAHVISSAHVSDRIVATC